MKSIMQTEKKCFVCGTVMNLHDHHCIHGTANRKQSERYGLKLWLCQEHHTGPISPHMDSRLDKVYKRMAQEAFESKWGNRDDFIRIFGKSYL